ncbi:hypothetical protein B0H11DRAFT_721547 [Mycena galericulata]|nr:hypothetical protein B0H11DRAFT_721547 [Mycena galericulata]
MAPRPSNALVLWDSNPTGVHTQEDLSVAVRGRWAIILKAFMSPSPGRTLDRIYTSLGRVLERHANRTAHSLGLGPHAVAQKIKSFFNNGEERVQRLELLRTAVPPKLQKRCLKLFEYTLPTESSEMQCQAFRDIVDLVTLFPGLRILFLPATPSDIATLRDTISTLWDRSPGTPNAEWTFWKTLASTCLTETTISAILDERSVSDLCDCQEGGLSVIEQLLLEHDSSGASIYSRTLCIRYLGGILDLPGFWLNF